MDKYNLANFRTPERDKLLRDMRACGVPSKDIMGALGISCGPFYQWVRALGLAVLKTAPSGEAYAAMRAAKADEPTPIARRVGRIARDGNAALPAGHPVAWSCISAAPWPRYEPLNG